MEESLEYLHVDIVRSLIAVTFLLIAMSAMYILNMRKKNKLNDGENYQHRLFLFDQMHCVRLTDVFLDVYTFM